MQSSKPIKHSLIFIFAFLVFVGIVYAAGVYNGSDGVQINHNLSRRIYVDYGSFKDCQEVENKSGQSIFVPTGTQPEWVAFKNNRPSNVNLKYSTQYSYKCSSSGVYYYDTCEIKQSRKPVSSSKYILIWLVIN